MKPRQSQMTSSRTQAAGPRKSAALGPDLRARIAKRAYELYEERGRQEGYALEDWLQAEQEIRQAERRGGSGR